MTNKEIAWSYFELVSEGRISEAQALLHDAGTLWSSGPRKAIPMRTQKATAAEILKAVPMRFTLLDAIAEGDKVVLELESHAKTEDGEDYNNIYAFIMTIFQGKILHIREHADTRHSMEKLPKKAWDVEKSRFAQHHQDDYYPDKADKPH